MITHKDAPVWTRNVSTVSTVTGIGRVLVAKRRTVVAFGLACCPRVSTVSTVTGIWRVLVAKHKTVVAFGLACCPRISYSDNSHRHRASRGLETQNLLSLLALCLVVAFQDCCRSWPRVSSLLLKSVCSDRGSGARGLEAQSCRRFWSRVSSLFLESVNSHI